MTRTHRRIQDGGNPAQGPVPEQANQPSSPRDLDEFPDRPEENEPGHESARDQDQPDPDAFAERLGLSHRGSTDDAPDDEHGAGADVRATAGAASRRARGVAASALSAAGSAAGAAQRTLGRWAERLRS